MTSIYRLCGPPLKCHLIRVLIWPAHLSNATTLSQETQKPWLGQLADKNCHSHVKKWTVRWSHSKRWEWPKVNPSHRHALRRQVLGLTELWFGRQCVCIYLYFIILSSGLGKRISSPGGCCDQNIILSLFPFGLLNHSEHTEQVADARSEKIMFHTCL